MHKEVKRGSAPWASAHDTPQPGRGTCCNSTLVRPGQADAMAAAASWPNNVLENWSHRARIKLVMAGRRPAERKRPASESSASDRSLKLRQVTVDATLRRAIAAESTAWRSTSISLKVRRRPPSTALRPTSTDATAPLPPMLTRGIPPSAAPTARHTFSRPSSLRLHGGGGGSLPSPSLCGRAGASTMNTSRTPVAVARKAMRDGSRASSAGGWGRRGLSDSRGRGPSG